MRLNCFMKNKILVTSTLIFASLFVNPVIAAGSSSDMVVTISGNGFNESDYSNGQRITDLTSSSSETKFSITSTYSTLVTGGYYIFLGSRLATSQTKSGYNDEYGNPIFTSAIPGVGFTVRASGYFYLLEYGNNGPRQKKVGVPSSLTAITTNQVNPPNVISGYLYAPDYGTTLYDAYFDVMYGEVEYAFYKIGTVTPGTYELSDYKQAMGLYTTVCASKVASGTECSANSVNASAYPIGTIKVTSQTCTIDDKASKTLTLDDISWQTVQSASSNTIIDSATEKSLSFNLTCDSTTVPKITLVDNNAKTSTNNYITTTLSGIGIQAKLNTASQTDVILSMNTAYPLTSDAVASNGTVVPITLDFNYFKIADSVDKGAVNAVVDLNFEYN